MKYFSKKPLDVWIFLIICFIGLFSLCSFFYSFFFASHNITGEYTTMVSIVNTDNEASIKSFNESNTTYAIKIQENDNYFLEFHRGTFKETGKFSVKKKQFDSLKDGMYKWFHLKASKPNDFTSGIVKEIYDYDPRSR